MGGAVLSTASIIVVVVRCSFVVVLEPIRQVLRYKLGAAELLRRRIIHSLPRAECSAHHVHLGWMAVALRQRLIWISGKHDCAHGGLHGNDLMLVLVMVTW